MDPDSIQQESNLLKQPPRTSSFFIFRALRAVMIRTLSFRSV